jgi:tetratricopeptide (TPR) repeat protein
MGRKRFTEASAALEQLERPGDPESLELRGGLALLSGDPQRARELAQQLRVTEQVGIAAMLEADAWMRDRKFEKALERFNEAVFVLGNEARARAAESLHEAGRTDLAEELLRRWVKAEPASADARFRLGSFLERRGRMSEAEAELRESLRIDPGDAEVLNYLGYSFADRNMRLDEALDLINRALKIEPWNSAYLDSLGWTYFRMGRFQEAREPLERAARDLPWDPTVLEHLGDVYERLGDRERAESSWQRALEAGAERADALRAKIFGTGSSQSVPAKPPGHTEDAPLGAAAGSRPPSSSQR